MKIAVITHILHKEKDGAYYSYEPYIREMNIWFKYVTSVIMVSPRSKVPLSNIESKYDMYGIAFSEVPQISLLTASEILKTIRYLPKIIFKVASAMKEADHIHLRCPGNIGLIGSIIQIFFPKKPKTVKYAGNWDPNAKQPWSYKLQRWIVQNPFLSKNMKVLAYGDWEVQTKNVLSFFTASYSQKDTGRYSKDFSQPLIFLFVGSLVEGKQPLFALRVFHNLLVQGFDLAMHFYGDGPLRQDLENYVRENELQAYITFFGNRSKEDLKKAYKSAHFVILPSKSEGWPKAIAEGMFFGCIPISTAISCVPTMLRGNSLRGILIENNEFSALNSIAEKLRDKEKLKRMSLAAQEWSQEYTMEKFEGEIRELL